MIRILLADDEELARVSIAYSLEYLYGDQVQIVAEASDGEEALQKIRSMPIDVVLTDIRMPRMDGLELVRALRSDNPDIQIVIISGYSEFEYARQALRLNVTDYLLKPINESHLKETIDRCMSRIAPSDQPEPDPALAIDEAIAYVDSHFQEDLFLEKLADQFNFSAKYLSSLFKRTTGKTFINYITELRIDRAKHLLTATPLDVRTVSLTVGYVDHHYFYRLFKKVTGLTPTEYRHKYQK